MNIAVFVYDDAEVLDFAGPFEVFSTAARLAVRGGKPSPFTVYLVAEKEGPVTARGGFRVMPSFNFNTMPEPDVFIVPGGVHEPQLKNREVITQLKKLYDGSEGRIIASVCTGAFLLAEAGLLSGRKAATHHEDAAVLQKNYPGIQVVSGKRWVDEGRIITSAGVSAGIDMILYLTGKLAGDELRELTARSLEWNQSG